jgi:hypothetical protein
MAKGVLRQHLDKSHLTLLVRYFLYKSLFGLS